MKKSMYIALFSGLLIYGCKKEETPPPKPQSVTPAPSATAPVPEPERSSGHSGEVIELGTAKIGDYEVRATRDKAEIEAGGDAPVDVWVDGGVGDGVSAVRFWIGLEDAKASIKARAEVENGKWHNHIEIPAPMPTGSMLWVEIEKADGTKIHGSFDLKM